MQAPVLVLNQNAQRESGRRAQQTNIAAARAVSDIIRTTLGPRAMMKMIIDAMGSLVVTNDGNAILREVDVAHPAAKAMLELSKTQDEEVGDGTTSVTVLAGELLACEEPFLSRDVHPTVIVRAMFAALGAAVDAAEAMAIEVDVADREKLAALVKSCLGTKFVTRYNDLMVGVALDAVAVVRTEVDGRPVVDVKNFAKVEKIPGGDVRDSRVLDGVMFNKDVCTAKMRRHIRDPRIVLADCPLEYRKAESNTNVEMAGEADFRRLLEVEEEYVTRMVDAVLAHKPDLVITEKGVSDLALHMFARAGVSVIRRLRKTDCNRIAKACGATIVSRAEELKPKDVGTRAGLFEVKKIGDEYFSFIVECKAAKACTVVLRGGTKDLLNEVERNLHDAMAVARTLMLTPRVVPGGGAVEMAVAHALRAKAKSVKGMQQLPYAAVADALEVIPRTLVENCGGNVVRTLTKLRAQHASGEDAGVYSGIDGTCGQVADMRETGVWDPLVVKTQTFKTAVEAAALLLRIDDIVSGLTKKKDKMDGHGEQHHDDE